MKLSRILLALLFVMVLAACSDADEDTTEAETDATEVTDEVEAEEESGIEVDKGLFNVEMTLPASLFGEDELAQIEADITSQADAEVTQNEDGSVTVKMSKSDHKKMLAEMKDELEASFDEIVQDDELASIEAIDYNNDFTHITMTVSDQASFENSFDGFATLSLGIGSMFYQAFNGKDLTKDTVTIEIVDGSTDETIHVVIYPDALDEMGELEE